MANGTNKNLFELMQKAQQEGNEPIARYIKTCLGKVGVEILDVFKGSPVVVELHGDPTSDNTPIEDVTVTFWTPYDHEYFRRANKVLLDRGLIAPYTKEVVEEISVNEVSDLEIEQILNKKYFALHAFLEKVTSPEPVRRALRIAKKMNKPARTIEVIHERLAELEETD